MKNVQKKRGKLARALIVLFVISVFLSVIGISVITTTDDRRAVERERASKNSYYQKSGGSYSGGSSNYNGSNNSYGNNGSYNTGNGYSSGIPSDAKGYNGHYYKVYTLSKSWKEAKAYCEELGGHLATITSAEEQTFIKTFSTGRYWLGGTDEQKEGTWKWITGEAWDYTNWNTGEPNNYSSGEDYLAIWPTKWNDLTNQSSEQSGFICEWDSYSSTGFVNSTTYYSLTTNSNLTDAGSYTEFSSSQKTEGASITLTANANLGYSFLGWYDGSTLLSTKTSYTFSMPAKNVTYTAKFEKQSYTFSTTTNLDGAGTYTKYDNNSVRYGDSVTLTASANSIGYSFIGWYDGTTELSTNTTYSFTMPAKNVTYTAKFEKKSYSLSVVTNLEGAGTITGASSERVTFGDSVTLTASVNEGYGFVGWYDGTTELSTNISYTFTMPAKNVTYTAKFESIPSDIPSDAKGYNGHYYKVYTLSKSWKEAKAYCENLGGHLATITSADEQTFIKTFSTGRYWLGGTDEEKEGTWKWITGETWSYTNWASGEPNGGTSENYLAIWSTKWNDLKNQSSEQSGFICEWDSYSCL